MDELRIGRRWLRRLCYFLGRRFGRTGNFNVSSSLHCCLHLCGNIGNLLLYDSLGPHNLLQLR